MARRATKTAAPPVPCWTGPGSAPCDAPRLYFSVHCREHAVERAITNAAFGLAEALFREDGEALTFDLVAMAEAVFTVDLCALVTGGPVTAAATPTRVCVQCGGDLPPDSRRERTTCSTRCRVAHHRATRSR